MRLGQIFRIVRASEASSRFERGLPNRFVCVCIVHCILCLLQTGVERFMDRFEQFRCHMPREWPRLHRGNFALVVAVSTFCIFLSGTKISPPPSFKTVAPPLVMHDTRKIWHNYDTRFAALGQPNHKLWPFPKNGRQRTRAGI